MDDRELPRSTPFEGSFSGDGAPAGGDGSAEQQATADRHAGAAAAHESEPNRLLRALPIEEYERLLLQLRPHRLPLKLVLIEPDAPITDVYFPREGVCSMIATEQEGGDIEVGTIGPDGFIGLPVLHSADRMPYRVIVQ